MYVCMLRLLSTVEYSTITVYTVEGRVLGFFKATIAKKDVFGKTQTLTWVCFSKNEQCNINQPASSISLCCPIESHLGYFNVWCQEWLLLDIPCIRIFPRFSSTAKVPLLKPVCSSLWIASTCSTYGIAKGVPRWFPSLHRASFCYFTEPFQLEAVYLPVTNHNKGPFLHENSSVWPDLAPKEHSPWSHPTPRRWWASPWSWRWSAGSGTWAWSRKSRPTRCRATSSRSGGPCLKGGRESAKTGFQKTKNQTLNNFLIK